MNCLQVPFHVHHAARSNEASRGSKSSKQYMAEKSLHKEAASLRHNFPCGQPSACTIYLDSLVAFPGSVPPPPGTPVHVEHEELAAVANPWVTQSTRCRKNSKANLARDPWAGKSIGTKAPPNATTKATTTDAWSLWKPGRLVVKFSSANSSVVGDDAFSFGMETPDAMQDESKNVHDLSGAVHAVAPSRRDMENSDGTSLLNSGILFGAASSPIAGHSAVDTLESPSADSWQQTLCIPSQHAHGKFISTYLEELRTVLNVCDDDEVEEIMETLSPLLAKAVQNHPTMEDCYALFEASDKFDMPEIDGVFACMKGNRSFAGPIWIAIQSIVLHRDSKPAPLIE